MACFTLGGINAQVLITEVSDPGDNYRNRFVEICNRGTATVDISGWELERYSNGNTTSQSVSVPSGTTLASGECHVFLNSQSQISPAPPCAQSTGVVSGNGDDAYNLTDGTNSVDTYGVIGVDGTNEDWEYTDAVAVRNSNVGAPTTTWDSSEWTITSGGTADGTPCEDDFPFAVKLVSFSATWNARNVELTWTTASEENNDYFVIERSTDGRDFISLDEVKGNGNAAREHNYSFIDYQPSFTNYYRLVQVDYDGTATTSEVVTARKELKDNVRLMNTRVESVVSIDNNTDDEIAYTIVAMDGRIIAEGQLQSGMNDVDCQSLQGGIYVFSMRMADQMISEKIQKL